MELAGFCFAHPEMFVVPVEHQTDDGIDDTFAAELVRRGLVDDDWIALLSRALVVYREHVADLFARARDGWFPPRRQNLCIVSEPDATRPYYQPFDRASWTLYRSDFDPRTSSVEHAAFQIAHAERLGITRHVARTITTGLAWLLVRTQDELDDFAEGCARSIRPDAAAFRAVADALPWIRRIHHVTLAPPGADAGPLIAVEGTQLLVPEDVGADLLALVERFAAAAPQLVQRHRAWQARPLAEAPRPADWLAEHRPRVRFVDADGRTLWDHERPDATEAIATGLRGANDRALASLLADLDAIGSHSARVLAGLRDPDALPTTASEVEADGGIWIDAARRTVVYSLAQPGLEVLHETAPPYHRLLAVARTLHEWGHLASDAGIVRLDPTRTDAHHDACDELAAIFAEIAAQCPAAAREAAEREHACRGADALGASLARTARSRMGDWQANLFARRFGPPTAMEAYVRANVRSLVHERSTGLLTRLARHGYEIQYLRLAGTRDAAKYFFESTWFDTSFVDTRVVSRALALRAFTAMTRVCECHAVDEDALVGLEPARPLAAWPA